jgi:hypothetical protein
MSECGGLFWLVSTDTAFVQATVNDPVASVTAGVEPWRAKMRCATLAAKPPALVRGQAPLSVNGGGKLNMFASFASDQYRRGQIGIRRLHQIEIGIP